MENATAIDPSVEVVDVAITGTVAATMPMANMATTAVVAKAKAKVKKQVTTWEREVQNQKRQAQWVAQRVRKDDAVTSALEEERHKRLR
jgi:hypothetical protein